MNINKKRVKELADKFQSSNILIIGDVMLDSYMWGNVNRISPEAPIPIVSINDSEFRLGGAANVALNIKALGANPILCSVTGNDNYSIIFKELLSKENINDMGIITDADRKTTVKTRIISKGQHILRVDEENINPVSDEITNVLLSKITEIIKSKNIKIIIFEDYDKGVITDKLIQDVKKSAKENNIAVCVDPKKNNFNNYSEISLFKPNFKEFCEGLKIEIDKKQINKLADVTKQFIKDNRIDILLITLSELGIFICDKNNWHHLPVKVRDISDVSGAGDTVISIASLFLSVNASLEEIATISNIAGGVVCEKTGVVPIKLDELLDEF